MQDWRGTTLKPGDLVVYTVRHGSSVTINEGVITELLPTQDKLWQTDRIRVTWLRSNDSFDNEFRKNNDVQIAIKNVTMIGVKR